VGLATFTWTASSGSAEWVVPFFIADRWFRQDEKCEEYYGLPTVRYLQPSRDIPDYDVPVAMDQVLRTVMLQHLCKWPSERARKRRAKAASKEAKVDSKEANVDSKEAKAAIAARALNLVLSRDDEEDDNDVDDTDEENEHKARQRALTYCQIAEACTVHKDPDCREPSCSIKSRWTPQYQHSSKSPFYVLHDRNTGFYPEY
jgi:hypothetical protein